jgi:predicted dehydrogenase
VSDLRAALIGYGMAGSIFHGPLLEAAPGIAVRTVVVRDPERAARARAAHPQARILADVAELWARADEHDLVVVAAPNVAHVPLARAAVEHGLPVVVDKPLAISAAAARELVALAQARGVPLTVFQNRRWDSDQLTLRRLLDEGALGEIVRYESRFERWRPNRPKDVWRKSLDPAAGGGELLDLGPHLVDQAVALFGPVARVTAELSAAEPDVPEDTIFLSLEHRGGVRSHLSASSRAAAPLARLRVLGSEAAFVVAREDGQEAALKAGRRPGDGEPWGVVPDALRGRLIAGERSVPLPSEPGAWDRFYPAVAAALRDGAPPPVDPRDAVAVLEVLDAARRSAAEGRTVELGG